MALGINTSNSTFLDFIKYDARAGKVFRVDSIQTPNGWDKDSIDITAQFQAAMDLGNAEVGWIDFSLGAPDYHMVQIGDNLPEKPSEEHKLGFRINLILGDAVRGDDESDSVRQWSSNAKTVIGAVDALHTAYEVAIRADDSLAVKVPVVKLVRVEGIKSRNGTNYAPVLEIVGWVETPAAFDTALENQAVQAPADNLSEDTLPF
jgi:hypothetical protein